MNKFFILLSALGFILLISACNTKKQDTEVKGSPAEKETFLGQESPGLFPELFAPDLVSTNALEIEAAISPDGKEFYFIRQKEGEAPKSHLVQLINGEWQDSETERPDGEVFISTDNNTMYLGNNYKERTEEGWTKEKSVGEQFDKYPIMRLTASKEDTYFFDERDSLGVIRYSRLVDGERENPKTLNKEINTGAYTAHPFIAPDESYLIWDSEREGGYGGSDLYISFRQDDGSWGAALNMGKEINTAIDDTYGSITSDGKYFFFNRIHLGETFEDCEADIYWMDAQVIENLRKK